VSEVPVAEGVTGRQGQHSLWPLLAFAAAIAVFPLFARGAYLQSVGATIGLFALMALGLALLIGYAGQISLGHAAFYGLGAYTSAIVCTRTHLNPWLGVLTGLVISGLVAYVVGRPTLRLHGHYLAMATLGFGVIVQIVLVQWTPVTGGFGGITSVPPLTVGPLVIQGDRLNFYLIWVCVLVALLLARNLVDSRVGRGLRAIHDSEVAASACGVDVARYKVQVFVLSALFASLAGSLYAHWISFVSPDPYGLALSVQILVMVIVGGSRSLWGPILGAVLMTGLSQRIEKTDAIKDLSEVVYGLALMLILVFMPQGLTGWIEAIGSRLRRGGGESTG
jgi:branched-chain amino acid transport system permease protein